MRDCGVEAEPKSWGEIWREFLVYAQQRNRWEAALENAPIEEFIIEASSREQYPTLYPGEVVGEIVIGRDTMRQGRNLQELTKRARANQHKQERKGETHKEKMIRLTKARGGRGGETPPRKEDRAARKLLGEKDDGRGRCKVFKEESMDLAHEEEYAKQPILRLFTRPEEMENGTYMHISKEDIRHMNEMGGEETHTNGSRGSIVTT
eukprot:6183709-Pleurochrysis_carterae.AAC.9